MDPEAPPLDSHVQGTSHSNISQSSRPAVMTQFSQQHMDPEAPPLDSHIQDVLSSRPDIDDKMMEADNDFGSSANPLWSLYGEEAKHHDEITVNYKG